MSLQGCTGINKVCLEAKDDQPNPVHNSSEEDDLPCSETLHMFQLRDIKPGAGPKHNHSSPVSGSTRVL